MLIKKKDGLAFSLLISLMVIILFFVIQIFMITPQQKNLDEIQFGKTIQSVDLLSKQVYLQDLFQKEIIHFSPYFYNYYYNFLILKSVDISCKDGDYQYLYDDYNNLENSCIPYLPLERVEYYSNFESQLLNQFESLSDKVSNDFVSIDVKSNIDDDTLNIYFDYDYSLSDQKFHTSILKTNTIEYEIGDFFDFFFDFSDKLNSLDSNSNEIFFCSVSIEDYQDCLERNLVNHFNGRYFDEVKIQGIQESNNKYEIDLLLIPVNNDFPEIEFSIRKLKTSDMNLEST